ncbi:hypothetical protein [Thermosulfurimonas sp. F29]|nr:hypothetical protein [Thermosulfurimonas sp. F29]
MRLKPGVLWWLAAGALIAGILAGGYHFVFSRAATLCLSCMGLQ